MSEQQSAAFDARFGKLVPPKQHAELLRRNPALKELMAHFLMREMQKGMDRFMGKKKAPKQELSSWATKEVPGSRAEEEPRSRPEGGPSSSREEEPGSSAEKELQVPASAEEEAAQSSFLYSELPEPLRDLGLAVRREAVVLDGEGSGKSYCVCWTPAAAFSI
uniref:Uncharacterized protein n=1 Tax=Alexandrium catenella TaxID=2925 RepID=A0A7S1RDK2_ALECA|mmetsp:Transcript_53525/g.143406  ORF Transcript_53525/g.143406 Transcript_53525/m.143406 type:complete len:163 (+) Transcript_53525:1-489(+)